MRSGKMKLRKLTWWLVVYRRQNPVEKFVLVEVALKAAEAIRSTVEENWQVVGVLQRSLVFVYFEPHAGREPSHERPGLKRL